MSRLRFAVAIVLLLGSINTYAQNALPHVHVYKTKKDYSALVPVQLSADKSKIVSYPSPQDVRASMSHSKPVRLHKGYWLDRMGVNLNTAYVKITLAAYAKMATAPSVDEMYQMIVDKKPMKTVCDCGVRNAKNTDPAALNKLIDANELQHQCKAVKQ
jgi:hypothetical protein